MTCRNSQIKPPPHVQFGETEGMRHFAPIARLNETVR